MAGPEINTSHLNVLITIFGETPWTNGRMRRRCIFPVTLE